MEKFRADGDVGKMSYFSYAQNFEDVRLWRAFSDVANGRYLDVGTQDPIRDSVSLLFYEHGWRGVHVEPTPDYAAAIRAARPDETVIQAAVSSMPGPIQLFEIPNTGLSTGIVSIAELHKASGWNCRELTVPTISLASLFEFMGSDPIHWLKVDVEGMEADALASWGDHPCRPAALVIEATAPNSQIPTHHDWLDGVLGRGYEEVLFDGLSLYFVHKTHAHRGAQLALSPNVFDGFQVPAAHFSAGAVVAEREARIDALRREKQAELEEAAARAADALSAATADAEARAAAAEAATESLLNDLASANLSLADVAHEVARFKDQLAEDAASHAKALALSHAEVAEKSSQLEVLAAEVAGLQEQMAAADALHANALTLSQAEVTEKSSQIAALEAEVAKLKDQLAEDATSHAEALAPLYAEVAEKSSQLEVLAAQVADLKAQLKAEAASHAESLGLSQAEVAKKSSQLEVLAAQVADLKDRLSAEAAAHEKALGVAREVDAAKSSQLSALGAEVAMLKEKLEAELAAHAGTLAAAHALDVEKSFQIGALGADVARLNERLVLEAAAHAQALAAARASETEKSGLLEQASQEIARLKGGIAKQEKAIAEAQAAACERLTLQDHQLADAAVRFGELQRDHAHLSREMGRLEGHWKAEAAAYSDAISASRQHEADLVALLEAANLDIAELRGLIEAKAAALDVANARIEQTLAELGAAREEVVRLGTVFQEREELLEQVQALESEIAQFRSEASIRGRELEQAVGHIAMTPQLLEGVSRSSRFIIRALVGQSMWSALSDHIAASAHWPIAPAQTAVSSGLQSPQIWLDDAAPVFEGRPMSGDQHMVGDKSPAVSSLASLLALQDREFIHVAYVTLLGRSPDQKGNDYYLSRLRSGEEKIAILKQLRVSGEGKAYNARVANLDRAIARYKLKKIPIIGSLVASLLGMGARSSTDRELRVLANQVFRLRQEQRRQLVLETSKIASRSASDVPEDVSPPIAEPSAFSPEPCDPPESNPNPADQSVSVSPIARRLSALPRDGLAGYFQNHIWIN